MTVCEMLEQSRAGAPKAGLLCIQVCTPHCPARGSLPLDLGATAGSLTCLPEDCSSLPRQTTWVATRCFNGAECIRAASWTRPPHVSPPLTTLLTSLKFHWPGQVTQREQVVYSGRPVLLLLGFKGHLGLRSSWPYWKGDLPQASLGLPHFFPGPQNVAGSAHHLLPQGLPSMPTLSV